MKNKFLWWALLSLGVGITFYLFRSVGFETFAAAILHGKLLKLAEAALLFVSIVLLRGYKWYWAANRLGYKEGLGFHYVSYFPQAMLSSFTPFRSGDLASPWLLNHGIGKGKFMSIILLDRIIELGILFGFGIFFGSQLLFFYWTRVFEDRFVQNTTILLWMLVVAVGLVFVLARFFNKRFHNIAGRLREIITIDLVIFYLILGLLAVSGDFIYVFLAVSAVTDIRIFDSFSAQVVSIVFSALTLVPMGLGTGTISYSFVMNSMGYNEQLIVIGSLLSKLLAIVLISLLGVGGLIWNRRFQRQ